MKTAIKICGIKTPEMAIFCAQAGAQFIGIVMHPASPRYVDINTAISIAKAAHQSGIIPVAVFVDADKDEMMSFCKSAHVDHVQLHGDKARAAFLMLPNNIRKIYVLDPTFSGVAPNSDFLLFDSNNPGTGEQIDWTNISVPNNIKFFLAGGLNVNNVKQAIEMLHPYAVDVSSGVELTRGEKSKELISAFINEVQNA